MSQQDAWYYATPQGERIGPITYQEIKALIQGGRVYRDDLVWAAHLPEWTPLDRIPELAGWSRQLPPNVPAGTSWHGTQDTIDTIKSLELASAVVWSLIAGVQILLSIWLEGPLSFMFIAGIWNIFAAISRFNLAKRIQERRKSVVTAYESVTQLVIIAIVNLVVGAVIGALWVIIDFIIRDKVLRNRHLFDQ